MFESIKLADVKGYEGVYQITANGEVFSMYTQSFKKAEVARNGYKRITLFKDGKGRHFLIHRLVAEAFLENPNGFEMVNHKDGNKLNNDVSNLEWCDASYNMKHAYKNNLIAIRTTRVIQYTRDFQKIREWQSIKEAAESLRINHANIITVCQQNTNRQFAGGFRWRYA